MKKKRFRARPRAELPLVEDTGDDLGDLIKSVRSSPLALRLRAAAADEDRADDLRREMREEYGREGGAL